MEYGIEMATDYLIYLKIMGYEPVCVCVCILCVCVLVNMIMII